MNKLFSVAKEITNPYSLAALFFLILYALYKTVLEKVGIQTDQHGFVILKLLMTIVAIIAVLTLILVFGLKAYQIYSRVNDAPKIESLGSKIEGSQNEIIKELNSAELTVEYSLSEWSGASLVIGNNANKIFLLKNLTAHWNYCKCSQFDEPLEGAPLIEYRYDLTLSTKNDSKIIESKMFKYGKGDIDRFYIDIHYPDYGIYKIWFTFDYKFFGKEDWLKYKTKIVSIENCSK